MRAIKTLVTSILLVASLATAQAQDSKAVDINNSSVVKQKPYCLHYENANTAKEGNFEKCLDQWVLGKFTYPQEALNKKIQGLVKVYFVIDKKGNLSVDKIEGEPILAAEGKRVFENFPKMMPAKDAQGREIPVQGMYPLEFSMNAVK